MESTINNFINKKVMIASPICKENEILKEFLESLGELETEGLYISYCFIDDNKDQLSSEVLKQFSTKNEVKFLNVNLPESVAYEYIDDHNWTSNVVQKVAFLKDEIIKYFLETDYDYIFFIDSDLVLHPKTLKSLISRDKNIISNIFWTKWSEGGAELPQVWVKDFYSLYDSSMLRNITKDEADKETNVFLNMLRKPGVYKVGGLGACTLIKREPLAKGVNFKSIYNVSFWGEDRHFCIRAVAYGYDLFVDTNYPAYHIYRKENLNGVKNYKYKCRGIDLYLIKKNLEKIVAEVVNSLENYSYKEKRDYLWENYFNEDEASRIKVLIEKENDYINQNKVVNRAHIEGFNESFNDNADEVKIDFKIINNGFKNSYNYMSEWESSAEAKLIDGSWIINNYEKKNSDEIYLPLIRKSKYDNKLTLSMIVRNEEGRYLERALQSHKEYIDNAVIIDDGSTDKTVQIVKDILGDKNLILIENKESLFSNETNLRQLQWNETIKTNPDWILNMDADEIFESNFKDGVRGLIENDLDIDGYSFRLYDFWNESSYREDQFWIAHRYYRMFLVRYQENFRYEWKEMAQHCGRFPYNVYQLSNNISQYRVKHMGWAREEDRLIKYNRYMQLDPTGEFGNVEQYKSILDENLNLVKWTE